VFFLQGFEVVVAVQGGVVGIGRFDVGDDAGAAIIVVRREEGAHLGGGGLGEVVVTGPEGGGEDELSGFRGEPGMTWRSVGWWGFLPSMLTTFAGRQGGVGFRVKPGMTVQDGQKKTHSGGDLPLWITFGFIIFLVVKTVKQVFES